MKSLLLITQERQGQAVDIKAKLQNLKDIFNPFTDIHIRGMFYKVFASIYLLESLYISVLVNPAKNIHSNFVFLKHCFLTLSKETPFKKLSIALVSKN